MPLGKRGCPKYSTVETEFDEDLHSTIDFHITRGCFDFILTPLADPRYRTSLGDKNAVVTPFASSSSPRDHKVWFNNVLGSRISSSAAKTSPWIDLDSEDDILRTDSEIALKQEIKRAIHLKIQACVLPTPKSASCTNYARCVNQILQPLDMKDIMLWLRIPLIKIDDGSPELNSDHSEDSWELWNAFCHLCDHHFNLGVALEFSSTTLPPELSLERWRGEPVRSVILQTKCFQPNAWGKPSLSMPYKKLVTSFFDYEIQMVFSGNSRDPLKASPIDADKHVDKESIQGKQSHPLWLYLEYVTILFKLNPFPQEEELEFDLRDFLHFTQEPFRNIRAEAYATLEMDTAKYIQYHEAAYKVLKDRVPDEEASSLTTVVVVAGAGFGLLVEVLVQVGQDTGRKLKIYAVERNPHAVVRLRSLAKKIDTWKNIVTIVCCDIRVWDAPEKADVLVGELFGSFGDNELSPEILDGAQRLLKENGISIPKSYTSFIQPVTASKLLNDVKSCRGLENPYMVKLHSVTRLAPPQPVFTFSHPNRSAKINNQRYKKLKFELPTGAGSALVHGFAGYFNAVLYNNVHLCTEPSTKTPELTRYPLFFPLKTPVYVQVGEPLEVSFWRRCSSTKVWHEWCVTSPSVSPIHNIDGRSNWASL